MALNEVVGENIFSLISTGSECGGFTTKADSEPSATGSSSVARVLRMGENVRTLHTGDLFYHNEHHTRYVRLRAEDALPLPSGSQPEKVIFGRYAAVSMTSIYQMKARSVDTIIVTGLGMVGIMCACTLQAFGFRVYAVDPSPERREIARQADIAYVGESLAALGAAEHSCGALIECSGSENALHAAIPYLRKMGEAFQIGVPWRKCSDWDAHDLLYQIFYSYISLHGGWEWSLPRQNDGVHIHSSYGHIQTAMELIAAGRIIVPRCMYEFRDPADCQAVYTELSSGTGGAVSVILDWRHSRQF